MENLLPNIFFIGDSVGKNAGLILSSVPFFSETLVLILKDKK
jgi:hypothetical protein